MKNSSRTPLSGKKLLFYGGDAVKVERTFQGMFAPLIVVLGTRLLGYSNVGLPATIRLDESSSALIDTAILIRSEK